MLTNRISAKLTQIRRKETIESPLRFHRTLPCLLIRVTEHDSAEEEPHSLFFPTSNFKLQQRRDFHELKSNKRLFWEGGTAAIVQQKGRRLKTSDIQKFAFRTTQRQRPENPHQWDAHVFIQLFLNLPFKINYCWMLVLAWCICAANPRLPLTLTRPFSRKMSCDAVLFDVKWHQSPSKTANI